MLLILTTPQIHTAPKGYTVIKTLQATKPLPHNISGPMDNPALKAILNGAKKIHADALLNFNCQTNGREIGCTGIALKHNFNTPQSNIFNARAELLFGNQFYQNPVNFPKGRAVGQNVSVVFYVPPNQYRMVAGTSTRKKDHWWGLRQKTQTVIKPSIPALCINALDFMHTIANKNHKSGLVNYNCYSSLSNLPGYIQVNANSNIT